VELVKMHILENDTLAIGYTTQNLPNGRLCVVFFKER
jgi:hypothetical protein